MSRTYNAWPAAMRRETAASYLDMSVAEFERGVFHGKIPQPIMFVERERWSKVALDEALEGKTGRHMTDWRSEQPLYKSQPQFNPASPAREAELNSGYAFTPASLAERWQCSAQSIRAMIKRGDLTALSFGKSHRIRPEEVARIESCVTEPRKE
ncbi:helix-turn-helix domain-containing protein [Allosphingosinicella deserti]|uniref:Helix-turn-helix domain-containing protein n=1 Tax=Allosphingosinicella deserti TaxID=2116704 RepID=A0A2P7QW22_9SPHN|nr:helix-turn-helix domain-containing protein [Sphingomonas deserti]PSJ42144.1 hypothetical protein C7I55_07880 [Sphingomonas deserti]